MKILLIRPYYGVTVHSDMAGDMGIAQFITHTYPDLSLIYATSIARNAGHDITVVEGNADKLLPAQIFLKLQELKTNFDKIIIKATAPTIQLDIVFAKKIKSMFPSGELILAGHVVKVLSRWLKEHIVEIDWPACEPLEEIMYFLVNGIHKKLTINELPLPDYTFFPYSKFTGFENRIRGTLYTSRGCSLHCSYCPYISYYGNQYEERDLSKVINDIKHQLQLGIREIQFRDQYFTYNRDRILEFCKMIKKENLKFSWTCETKIDTLDIALLDEMIDAGMTMIVFGIESASKDILKKYKRIGIQVEKALKIMEFLNIKKVHTIGFYIIGFPGETDDMMMNTYRLAQDLNTTYVTFNIWTPYPQTLSWETLGLSADITPYLFAPLENRMNIQSAYLPDYRMMAFIEKQLLMMYTINTRGLESAFHDAVKYMPGLLSHINPAYELFTKRMGELQDITIKNRSVSVKN